MQVDHLSHYSRSHRTVEDQGMQRGLVWERGEPHRGGAFAELRENAAQLDLLNVSRVVFFLHHEATAAQQINPVLDLSTSSSLPLYLQLSTWLPPALYLTSNPLPLCLQLSTSLGSPLPYLQTAAT